VLEVFQETFTQGVGCPIQLGSGDETRRPALSPAFNGGAHLRPAFNEGCGKGERRGEERSTCSPAQRVGSLI
jgi:hypothetical protein